MADPVRSTNLPAVSSAIELVVNYELGPSRATGRMPIASARQLLMAAVAPPVAFVSELTLNWPAGVETRVYGEANPSSNGVYLKTGASGAGSWTRIGALPAEDGGVLGAVAGEVVTARAGAPSLADRFHTIDVGLGAVESEVVTARAGSPSLTDRFHTIDVGLITSIDETATFQPVGNPATPVAAAAMSHTVFAFPDPIGKDGPLSRFRGVGLNGGGLVRIKQGSIVGNTFTQVGPDLPVPVAAGEFDLDAKALGYFPLQAGLCLAILPGDASARYLGSTNATGSVAATPVLSATPGSGDQTSFTGTLVTNARLEMQFEVGAPAERGSLGRVAQAASVTGAALELLSSTQRIGCPGTPASAPNLNTGTYVFGDAVSASGYLVGLALYSTDASTIRLKRFTKAGDVFTQVGADTLARVAVGLNILTMADIGVMPVSAGEYLGWFGPSLVRTA
ncbi:MAG: hypothetical protein J0J10_23090, partial [Bosea sp.]|nr:hypothetical protein [Bosea sp. (in: a-proteobacteria)]